MTKLTLGELIGVSSTTISNYEAERNEVPAEKAQAISAYLRQPLEFFTVPPDAVDVGEPVQFRSLKMSRKRKAPVLVRLSWLLELASLVDRYVDLPSSNLPDPPSRLPGTGLSLETIEQVASEVRSSWGLNDGPVRDLAFVAESNGVILQAFGFEPVDIDGVSRWASDLRRPIVILNSARENMVRTRFSLAHELGHICLHRSLADSEAVALGQRALEAEANRFASALLLPKASWLREARRARTLSGFQALKPRWKVSIKAMLFRSHSLGLIGPERYKQLLKQYSTRRWNHGEPFDRDWPVESPSLLRESAELLAGHDIRTQVAQELLPLDAVDLETLLGTDAFSGGGWARVSIKEDLGSGSRIHADGPPRELPN